MEHISPCVSSDTRLRLPLECDNWKAQIDLQLEFKVSNSLPAVPQNRDRAHWQKQVAVPNELELSVYKTTKVLCWAGHIPRSIVSLATQTYWSHTAWLTDSKVSSYSTRQVPKLDPLRKTDAVTRGFLFLAFLSLCLLHLRCALVS